MSKAETIRKNLLDLDHQHLLNYVNIAVISEASLLIALWAGGFGAETKAKVEWSTYSILFLVLVLLELYRRIGMVKQKIERL